jgi:spoIIIJ-associated protein
MEWVETTGKTVDEAKDRALDRLGVAEDEAELEILEEPKVGFLGMRKTEARVRARVRPNQPRPKAERRDRNRRDRGGRKRDEGGGREKTAAEESSAAGRGSAKDSAVAVETATTQGARRAQEGVTVTEETTHAESARSEVPRAPRAGGVLPHDEHVAVARDFVSGLIGAFGVTGEVVVHTDEDESVVEVQGADLGLLIGPQGRTAEAIGDLSRSAVLRRAGDRDTEGRVTVDVAGLRARRREALERFAIAQAEAVVADGKARALEPMGSADRKVVHDALVDAEGVQTLSEGEDPYRRVVIAPA